MQQIPSAIRVMLDDARNDAASQRDACRRVAHRIKTSGRRAIGFCPAGEHAATMPVALRLGLEIYALTGDPVALVDANVRYPAFTQDNLVLESSGTGRGWAAGVTGGGGPPRSVTAGRLRPRTRSRGGGAGQDPRCPAPTSADALGLFADRTHCRLRSSETFRSCSADPDQAGAGEIFVEQEICDGLVLLTPKEIGVAGAGVPQLELLVAHYREKETMVLADLTGFDLLGDHLNAASLLDGVIIVARAGHTKEIELLRLKAEFTPERIIGVVLTGT